MSGVYQIPGLILTVLCHTMVAYPELFTAV